MTATTHEDESQPPENFSEIAEIAAKPGAPGGFGGFGGFGEVFWRSEFASSAISEVSEKFSGDSEFDRPGQWLLGLLDCLGAGHVGRLYQCPAHEDSTPSLSVRDMPDGCAAIKCFTGCSTTQILSALRLTKRVLRRAPSTPPEKFAAMSRLSVAFPPVTSPRRNGGRGDGWRFEAAHEYGDRWRLVRFRHTSGKKDLLWETRDEHGAWIPGLRGVASTTDLPLYYAVEVGHAVAAGETIYLVESESSADAFISRGIYATTWAGGAGSVRAFLPILSVTLRNADVVLIPDNDDAGLRCADEIRQVLPDLRTVLPDTGHDARDLLARYPERLKGV